MHRSKSSESILTVVRSADATLVRTSRIKKAGTALPFARPITTTTTPSPSACFWANLPESGWDSSVFCVSFPLIHAEATGLPRRPYRSELTEVINRLLQKLQRQESSTRTARLTPVPARPVT